MSISRFASGPGLVFWLPRFSRDDSGATSIEYAFIAAGIALAIITGVGLVGTGLSTGFGDIAALL